MNAVNQGRTCTYNDVPGPGWSIRAYCEKAQDYGKTVTIYGLDNNNQPLATLNPGNFWTEGITLTLGNPYFDTAHAARSKRFTAWSNSRRKGG